MADDGGIGASEGISSATDAGYSSHNASQQLHVSKNSLGPSRQSTFDQLDGGAMTPMGGNKRESKHIMELDDYFVGPRDLDRHSKLPYFLRLHGSVVPRMLLPLMFIGAWATLITCLTKFVHNLAVNTLLLTVLGFVVGLALSFRSSTAYERYSDGRKAWATLAVQSRNLGRYTWVHITEREGDAGKDDLLAKLTCINLIQSFAVALKHRLRFEPYAHYPDIASLVGHLDTFARSAYEPAVEEKKKRSFFKMVGNYLGLTIATSNPRKVIKEASRPLGNLPLEILTYLSCYYEDCAVNGTLKSPVVLGQILASIASLTDTMSSAERVLTTPLPIGYNILISQIVLLYVYLLPFQLVGALGWICIPGTIAAAYIILGLAAIGNELENPFGDDVNDLPLDYYCDELRREMDVLTSMPPINFQAQMIQGAGAGTNKVLWPLSTSSSKDWRGRSVADIRSALKAKVVVAGSPPGSSGGTTLKSKTGEV